MYSDYGRPSSNQVGSHRRSKGNCKCPPEDLVWRTLVESADILNNLSVGSMAILTSDAADKIADNARGISNAFQRILTGNRIEGSARRDSITIIDIYERISRHIKNRPRIPNQAYARQLTAIYRESDSTEATSELFKNYQRSIRRGDLYNLAGLLAENLMLFMNVLEGT